MYQHRGYRAVACSIVASQKFFLESTLLHITPRDSGPIYYGYYLVGAAFVAQFISTGMYSYVLGSFMAPMTDELGWSRADFTLTRTIGQMVMAVVGIYIGSRVDVYGGRPIMLVGSLILGLTLALTSQIDSLWAWLLLNGVLVTIGCAMLGNLVVNVTLSKWFVERRGIVISVAAMGVSFGGVVLTPLATWLVDTVGWREAWLWLGLSATVLTLPLAAIMRRAPEDHGLYPDGYSATQIEQGMGERARLELAASFTRAQAVRTFSFYALVIAFGFFSINIFVLLIHTVPFLSDSGLSRNEAAFAMLVASVPAMVSKPFWGYWIDRTPAKPVGRRLCGDYRYRTFLDRLCDCVPRAGLGLRGIRSLGAGLGRYDSLCRKLFGPHFLAANSLAPYAVLPCPLPWR
jgi:sugar phosphate permease